MGDSCKIVCNYHKQRRPYTARDAGRVICYAREGGATWEEVKKAANERCGPIEVEDCDCEKLKSIIKAYETIMAVALSLVALAIPVASVLRIPAVIKILSQIKLPAEAIKVIKKAPTLEKLLTDGKNTLEAEFKILKDDPAIIPGIVIKEP